jgi:thiol reductant ABC exporter CydC subunit
MFRLAAVPPWRLAASATLAALAVACGVALLTSAGYLISRAAEQPPILALTTTIVAVRFFGLARPGVRYLDRLVSHDVALRALARIRRRFYERIEPLAPGELQAYRSGDLLTRMVADVDALQGLTVRALNPLVAAVAVSALAVGLTAALLPLAALVLACGLLVAGTVVPALTGALARRAGEQQAAARAELTSELVELLQAAPELVVHGGEEETLERVGTLDRRLSALGRRDALVGGLGDGLTILVAGLTVAGVLASAIGAHDAGTLDRVLVATLALLAWSSFDAVAPLPGVARELPAMLAAGRRTLELVEREPAVLDPAEPQPAPAACPRLELQGVTVRYPGADEPVLAGADLVLEPGRHIALVGPSGAGKSTIVSVLLRFLDPEAGRVTLAGRDLRDYRLEDVRAVFAVAGQEAHVFDSTIRENLLLAAPGASDEALWASLARARLDDWVSSLPDGLETFVGEEGSALSGGQRQRLTIARAFLSRAPVLVLDEPTAHLDVENAEALLRDTLQAARDRTVLLITHRAEGLDLVDDVFRLDAGRIARVG